MVTALIVGVVIDLAIAGLIIFGIIFCVKKFIEWLHK